MIILSYLISLRASLTDKDLVKIVAPKTTTNTSHIMINGEPVTLMDKPLEVVISQQVATVSISTEVAEQVNITTKARSYEQTVPVMLRHEELRLKKPNLIHHKWLIVNQ